MNTLKIRNSLLLVLTAFIWGVAFVAQSTGGEAIGAYSFNSIRMMLGGFVLMPVILFLNYKKEKKGEKKTETKQQKKTLYLGGLCCGIALFFASNLQQVGINLGVSAGKAGFLTACYILLVPIFGLFLKKKCGMNIWIGVVLAVAGLYLLCMNGRLRLEVCDICVLLCAVCFALHILIVDHFSPLVDGVKLSCLQFLICGFLGIVPMVGVDILSSDMGFLGWLQALMAPQAWIPILYAGFLSCGVAYTLQIIGQVGLNPTVASLIMSLESVFSALAGWLILRQILRPKELIGCILIFAAIILAQIDFSIIRKKQQ